MENSSSPDNGSPGRGRGQWRGDGLSHVTCQRGHGQNIEPVVNDDVGQRRRVTRLQKREIPPGNLRAGHVARPMQAQHFLFQAGQATAFQAGVPQAPRGLQQIQVRQARQAHAVHDGAGFQKGPVKTAAVERHHAGRFQLGQKRRHGRPLFVKILQQKLSQEKAAAGEPAHADQKRVRAGAAAQTRRFQVDERRFLHGEAARRATGAARRGRPLAPRCPAAGDRGDGPADTTVRRKAPFRRT